MSLKRQHSKSDLNIQIYEFLIELSEYEWNVNRKIHKSKAYKRAAESIRAYPSEIKSGKEARKLDGVGAKIEAKINEFLATGKVEKLNKIRKDESYQAISKLTEVSGIGPVAAQNLVDKGITNLHILKKHTNLLNKHQRLGIKYFNEFNKRIPQEEIKYFDELLSDCMKLLDPAYKYTICGSYRREEPTSGDIDILLTHSKYRSSQGKNNNFLPQLVEHLKDKKIIADTLSAGDTKFMGVCSYPVKKASQKISYRRIDIRLVPSDQYFCALLYFTGSDLFNKRMRTHAVDKGFTINEYCIRYQGVTGIPGEPLPVSSEKDIFDYIDFPYHEPKQRFA